MPFIPNKAEPSGTPLTPSSATSSTSTGELAVNVAFGLCAVAGTAITLWQAHRLWRIFRHHTSHSAHAHEDDGTFATPFDEDQADALLPEAISTVDVELASVGTMSPTGTATYVFPQAFPCGSKARSHRLYIALVHPGMSQQPAALSQGKILLPKDDGQTQQ